MSWNGTLRCSYCYHQGHNKRKCPKRNADDLQSYKEYIEHSQRNPEDTYYPQWAERYRQDLIKRTGVDPKTGLKVKKKTAKAERMKSVRCTYCRQTGHTRRICKPLKEDYAFFIEGCKVVRAATLTRMKKEGWGVGALIVGNAWINEAHVPRPFLLTRLNWYDVTAYTGIDICGVFQRLDAMTDHYGRQSHAMVRVANRPERYKYSGSSSPCEPPAGWLDAEDIAKRKIKEFFPVGVSRSWRFTTDEIRAPKWLTEVRARKCAPEAP